MDKKITLDLDTTILCKKSEIISAYLAELSDVIYRMQDELTEVDNIGCHDTTEFDNLLDEDEEETTANYFENRRVKNS